MDMDKYDAKELRRAERRRDRRAQAGPWTFWRAVAAIYIALCAAGVTFGVVAYIWARVVADDIAEGIGQSIDGRARHAAPEHLAPQARAH